MTRALHLNRDQAEMLDDMLLEEAVRQGGCFDFRLIEVAEQLRETWGWSRWDKRPVKLVTTDKYEAWLSQVEDWLTDWIKKD